VLSARLLTGSAAAATTPGDTLYVNNAAPGPCSDSFPGGGTPAQPFCTVGAASKAAKPGQTVIIEPGLYPPDTISASGTASQPITFLGARDGTSQLLPTAVGGPDLSPLVVAGAHNVVISGFEAFPAVGGHHPAIKVTGPSTGVTISSSLLGGNTSVFPGTGPSTEPAIEVDGSASDVTISRNSIFGGKGVQVDAGASGVVVTGNTLNSGTPDRVSNVVITDAPGTIVTGNTLVADCGPNIEVTGASPGTTIENNIMQPGNAACVATASAISGISVSAGSAAQTVTDYNVINPGSGIPLYDWGGTSYSSLTDFQAATGQGGHDIAKDPKLSLTGDDFPLLGKTRWYAPAGDSPALDSANANAPGELIRDQLNNPRADDPDVVDGGTGYFDRGAVELQGPVTFSKGTVASSGSLTVTAHQGLTSSWTTNGPVGLYVYDFGDGSFPMVTTAPGDVRHAYRTAGFHLVKFTGIFPRAGGAQFGNNANVEVGAAYTPVTPTRILDTRNGTGAARAGAVPSKGTLTLAIPGAGGVAAADMTAVVMNVTVTQPARNGWLAAFPAGSATSAPAVSNLNFTAGQTVANLVTAQVSGGKVSFYNGSGGTVQVIADLAGFYGPGGSGFQPRLPARVLDTRNGTGAATSPVAAHTRVRLSLAGKVPAGTTAVVLNVTATQPTQSGWLAAYPDSAAVPATSSLNFTRGQTVANQVIVSLNGGIVDLYNGSAGTVHVVADLDGDYAASAPDLFVPYGPTRITDTRATSSPLPASTGRSYPAAYLNDGCSPACPLPAAVVDNVTVTQSQHDGYLTVYPSGQPRPGTSSLNFRAGQTVPNLVTTQAGNGNVTFYNASGGTVQLIVDEFGYFIPATP
jgi:hypothetical protein